MGENGRYLGWKSISPPGNKPFIFLGRDEAKSHVLDEKSGHIKLTAQLKKLKTGKNPNPGMEPRPPALQVVKNPKIKLSSTEQ